VLKGVTADAIRPSKPLASRDALRRNAASQYLP